MNFYYHPIFVHFPIAFFFLEILLLIFWGVRKKKLYFRLSIFALNLGYIGLILTMVTGIIDAGGFSDLIGGPLQKHFLTSTITFLVYTFRVLYLRKKASVLSSLTKGHIIRAILGFALVMLASLFGGELVYAS